MRRCIGAWMRRCVGASVRRCAGARVRGCVGAWAQKPRTPLRGPGRFVADLVAATGSSLHLRSLVAPRVLGQGGNRDARGGISSVGATPFIHFVPYRTTNVIGYCSAGRTAPPAPNTGGFGDTCFWRRDAPGGDRGQARGATAAAQRPPGPPRGSLGRAPVGRHCPPSPPPGSPPRRPLAPAPTRSDGTRSEVHALKGEKVTVLEGASISGPIRVPGSHSRPLPTPALLAVPACS